LCISIALDNYKNTSKPELTKASIKEYSKEDLKYLKEKFLEKLERL